MSRAVTASTGEPQPATRAFLDALALLESAGDPEPLVRLYDGEAEVGGASALDVLHGVDGARQFWTHYRATFDDMRTTFRTVAEGSSCAALEWHTDATSQDLAISYDGVTIIEFRDGRLVRSFAYFDTRQLARQLTRRADKTDTTTAEDEQEAPAGSQGGYRP